MFASSKSVSVSKRGQTSSHLKRLSHWCFWMILEMFLKWSFIKLHTQYLNHFSIVAFLFSIGGRRSNWSAIAFPSVPNPPHHHLCVVRRMLLLKLMFNTTRLYTEFVKTKEYPLIVFVVYYIRHQRIKIQKVLSDKAAKLMQPKNKMCSLLFWEL